MRKLSSVSTVLAVALVLGCEGEPTGSAVDADPGSPALSMGPPSSSGVVLRIELVRGATWWALRDPNRNLLALYSGDPLSCEEPTDDYGVAQLVFTPAGPIHQLTKGEQIRVTVYDVTGNPTRDCDFWTGASGHLIAQGRADFNWLDNDLAVSGPGANVWGPNSNGTLDNLVDGGTLQYNLKFRWRVTPAGSYARLVDNIKLTPDPR